MNAINTYIDHTLLKPLASITELVKCVQELEEYDFRGLCLSPYHWHYLRQERMRIKQLRSVVIGFPHGNEPTKVKQRLMEQLASEVDEYDIVINLQALSAGQWDTVAREVERLSAFCKVNGHVDKWIIESSLLKQNELEEICLIMNKMDVAFVKTSTGFNGAGANVGDVALMRKLLKEPIQIKASGGIHTLAEATDFIELGATRLGMSKSVEVMKEWQKQQA